MNEITYETETVTETATEEKANAEESTEETGTVVSHTTRYITVSHKTLPVLYFLGRK